MKRWSFSIATIAGTEVRIHATFLLLLAFLAMQAARYGGSAVMIQVVMFVVAVFTCVLLHEFGHVFAARRYGIRTPDITLLPIGGLARLERMPREPSQELIVAIAGPAVNVVIAVLIIAILQAWPGMGFDLNLEGSSFFVQLARWNILMVLFNLIPAFPMDGGRVLRAVLVMVTKNYARATRLAASVGQSIAVFGAILGIFFMEHGFMIVLIAVFIFLAAGQEAAYVSEQESMSGSLVRDAMITHFQSLPIGAQLQDAVTLLLAGSQHDFPVIDREGEFAGLLTRKNLISALADHGPLHPVADVMQPCTETTQPYHSLMTAMETLRGSDCPVLPVMDPQSNRLEGLLTMENIGEMMMVRSALQERQPGAA